MTDLEDPTEASFTTDSRENEPAVRSDVPSPKSPPPKPPARGMGPLRYPSGSLLSLADMRGASVPAPRAIGLEDTEAVTGARIGHTPPGDATGERAGEEARSERPQAGPGRVDESAPAAVALDLAGALADMRARIALDDFSGALELCDRILVATEAPGDHPKCGLEPAVVRAEAERCASRCRAALQGMYLSRIGPLSRVPRVAVAQHQLRWLSLDHRAGFVLSLVDGVMSLETICDLSGMKPLDTLRILCELADKRIISFAP